MSVPALMLHTDTQHGVAIYARRLGEAVRDAGADVAFPVDNALDSAVEGPLHVHFTDRLWGATAEEAAERFEKLARVHLTTVTMHDLPQTSDGAAMDRRVAAYRRVAASAVRVAVNSEHESALLLEIGATAGRKPVVIPLPVDHDPQGNAPRRHPTVAVLGFVYPGKGHDAVIEAVAGIPGRPLTVEALGRPSDGHEGDAERLASLATTLGIQFVVSGFLPDDELVARCRSAGVPVVAHSHFSASGSMNSWIASGRRPIVLDSDYTREMALLRPGTLTLVSQSDLPGAIERAWDDPESTWIDAGATTRPDSRDTAEHYLRFWREVHG